MTLGEPDELVHAYAITVHREPGSEQFCVVIPITTSAWMLRRNRPPPAVTGTEKLVVLIGSLKALSRPCALPAPDADTLSPTGSTTRRDVGRPHSRPPAGDVLRSRPRGSTPPARHMPTRIDVAAQLPLRGDPGSRAGDHLRGGLRALGVTAPGHRQTPDLQDHRWVERSGRVRRPESEQERGREDPQTSKGAHEPSWSDRSECDDKRHT